MRLAWASWAAWDIIHQSIDVIIRIILTVAAAAAADRARYTDNWRSICPISSVAYVRPIRPSL